MCATAQHSENELRALSSKSTPATDTLRRHHLTGDDAAARSRGSETPSGARVLPETEAILNQLAEKVEEERRNRNAADECAKRLIQDLLVARSHAATPEKEIGFHAYTQHESELQKQLSSTSLALAKSKELLKSTESILARKVDENKQLTQQIRARERDLTRERGTMTHNSSADRHEDLQEHPSRERTNSTNPFDDDELFLGTVAEEGKRLFHASSGCEHCRALENRCHVKDQQLLEMQKKYTSQKTKYHIQARTLKEHIIRLEGDLKTLRTNLAQREEDLEDQKQVGKSWQFASTMQSEEMRKQIKSLDLTTQTVSDLLKNALKAQVLQAHERPTGAVIPPKDGMQRDSDTVRMFVDLQRRFLVLQSEDMSKKLKIDELERTICRLHGVLIEQETFYAQRHQEKSQRRRKSVSFSRDLEASPMKSLELSSVRGDDEVETAGENVEFKFTQLERTIWSLQDTMHGAEQHPDTLRKLQVADESEPDAGINSVSRLRQRVAQKDMELEKTRELLAEAQASYRSQSKVAQLQEEHIKNLRRTSLLHDRQAQEFQVQRNALRRAAEDLAASMALQQSENVSLWRQNHELRQNEEKQRWGGRSRSRSRSRGAGVFADGEKEQQQRERSRGSSRGRREVVEGSQKERRGSREGREGAAKEMSVSNREIESLKAKHDAMEVALQTAQKELNKVSLQFREQSEREGALLDQIKEQRLALDEAEKYLKSFFRTAKKLEDAALLYLLACNNLAGLHSSLRWRIERSRQVSVACRRLYQEMQQLLKAQASEITRAEACRKHAALTVPAPMHSEIEQMLDTLSKTTDAVAELLKEALLRSNWDGEAKSCLLQRQVKEMHQSYSQAVMQGVLESSEMLQMQATCTFVTEELLVKDRLISLMEDEMRDMHEKFQSLSRSSDRSRSEDRGDRHPWPQSPIAPTEQSPAARAVTHERFDSADPSDSDTSSQGLAIPGIAALQETSAHRSPSMAAGSEAEAEALGRELVAACGSVDALLVLLHAVSSACRLQSELSARDTDALSHNEQLPKLIVEHVLSLVDVTGYAVSSNSALSATLERFFQRQFQAWFAEVRDLREQKKRLSAALSAVKEELRDVREVMTEIEQDSILEKDWREFETNRRQNRGIPSLPRSFYGTPSPPKEEAGHTSASLQTPPADTVESHSACQTRSDEDAVADKLEIQRLELSLAQQINKNMEMLDKMVQLSEAKDGLAAENQDLLAKLGNVSNPDAASDSDFELFDDT